MFKCGTSSPTNSYFAMPSDGYEKRYFEDSRLPYHCLTLRVNVVRLSTAPPEYKAVRLPWKDRCTILILLKQLHILPSYSLLLPEGNHDLQILRCIANPYTLNSFIVNKF